MTLTLGEDVRWAAEHAWAPTIVERDGRYWFYFTAESTIGVAVADHPTGPFTDLGHVLIDDGDFPGQMIDPSVFVDDGRYFLAWGNTGAHVVELGDDMISFGRDAVVSTQPPGFRVPPLRHPRRQRSHARDRLRSAAPHRRRVARARRAPAQPVRPPAPLRSR